MSEEEFNEEDRLPPPAFPPGGERRRSSPARVTAADLPDGAFISPDDPIIRSGPLQLPDAGDEAPSMEGDEVVVTGIGDDDHLLPTPDGSMRSLDPVVEELLDVLRTLTTSVERKGEAGLRATPSMGRFETTLRGYCVGYLAGLRERGDQVVSRPEE